MLDCGMHMGYNDDRRFPDFSYITQNGRLTEFLDCVIISALKSYSIQHVPDGTVIVESIVIKVTSSAEVPNLKVILLSWSYQDEELGSFLSTLLKKRLPS
ncbi:integrator complex subunit 11-like [Sinocyclocheilus grahami]|uniref:integrator complex subunit 11-like n=1 Tax=Sinocyclocheilus grahami TaxID=75366 RepID=UPI0007AD30A9|nr:PREDICTED: integrator complex subunit 11-like [Sinocyclocheilus grahami]